MLVFGRTAGVVLLLDAVGVGVGIGVGAGAGSGAGVGIFCLMGGNAWLCIPSYETMTYFEFLASLSTCFLALQVCDVHL